MPQRHLLQIGLHASEPPPSERVPEGAHGYPRPQLRRDSWVSLNGPWDFALDPEARWGLPGEVAWAGTIEVPYAPETARSGVGDTGLYRACWYRRRLDVPPLSPDERLVLHFGAVDYEASVWLDGALVRRHEGGYTPFSVDLTDHLNRPGPYELVVRAEDDPADLAKPRGKQDWQLEPHSIWYPRTTGIWQTVWLERVPRRHIAALRWTTNLDRWEIGVEAHLAPPGERGLELAVSLRARGLLLSRDRYSVVAGEVHRRIALSDPGIDDFRNELLWSPAKPTLIVADLELFDAEGRLLDKVASYTALRSFASEGDRFVLNGRPYPLRLVLDQGYWPATGMTPPDDAALRRDVELAKQMGFNGVRKHQKIEDPRYLYWADRLGLLVWEEMPSAYRFTRRSVERLTPQWLEVLRRDTSHPCIVAWVPFNESWGVPNLPGNAPERDYVRSLYYLTRTIDPTRLVVGNDGWESVATDVIGIHDYEGDPRKLVARYATHEAAPRVLTRERPGGRRLVLEGHDDPAGRPMVLSEFGGIALSSEGESWGYSRCRTPAELEERYRDILHAVHSRELFAGFCYTQFADTYQEANGLLTMGREPKFSLEAMRAATSGEAFVGDAETAGEGPLSERQGAP
jgi:beta-galactosidase/beta-glucuronidase